jgi:hypothetical protein
MDGLVPGTCPNDMLNAEEKQSKHRADASPTCIACLPMQMARDEWAIRSGGFLTPLQEASKAASNLEISSCARAVLTSRRASLHPRAISSASAGILNSGACCSLIAACVVMA